MQPWCSTTGRPRPRTFVPHADSICWKAATCCAASAKPGLCSAPGILLQGMADSSALAAAAAAVPSAVPVAPPEAGPQVKDR